MTSCVWIRFTFGSNSQSLLTCFVLPSFLLGAACLVFSVRQISTESRKNFYEAPKGKVALNSLDGSCDRASWNGIFQLESYNGFAPILPLLIVTNSSTVLKIIQRHVWERVMGRRWDIDVVNLNIHLYSKTREGGQAQVIIHKLFWKSLRSLVVVACLARKGLREAVISYVSRCSRYSTRK
mgnify:CR=1 FL=1